MTDGSNPGGNTLTRGLVDGLQNLAGAVRERAESRLGEKIGGLTDGLTGQGGQEGPRQAALAAATQKLTSGGSPASAAVSAGMAGGKEKLGQAFGKRGKKGQMDPKVTNIIESIDVGASVQLVYNQWTQFKDFPSFMKKVESVEQESDEKLTWKAQIFWSHRNWESTIIEQVPDERIVWKSKGSKGSVDGAVSFHELAPDLTRIMLVLQYHPQGFVEMTANLWRAQGRRARLELKHFVRHVMTETILHPDDVPGWRGEIRDCQVVQKEESAQSQQPS